MVLVTCHKNKLAYFYGMGLNEADTNKSSSILTYSKRGQTSYTQWWLGIQVNWGKSNWKDEECGEVIEEVRVRLWVVKLGMCVLKLLFKDTTILNIFLNRERTSFFPTDLFPYILSITTLKIALKCNDQNNIMHSYYAQAHVDCNYAKCHYTECYYADCLGILPSYVMVTNYTNPRIKII
jgi:hypothetical protein